MKSEVCSTLSDVGGVDLPLIVGEVRRPYVSKYKQAIRKQRPGLR